MQQRPRHHQIARPDPDGGGVYVNCILDLRHVTAVGLDLDHTLAVYDDRRVNALAFAETCRNLVDIRGYHSRVGRLEYDHDAVARGLVADVRRGILVKLDHQDRVVRARLGNRFLGSIDIDRTYGRNPFSCDGSYQVQSPFDLPAAALFAALSEQQPAATGSDIQSVLSDIVTMLDRAHRFGQLKRRIMDNPGRYIERRPGVDEMIMRVRESGKKTFVLTNSGPRYTMDVLEHLFPRRSGRGGWQELFDAVFVDANKPEFFYSAAGPGRRRPAGGEGARPLIWRSTHAGALERSFETTGDRVLYIGDNPGADSVAARARGWRTALVVPELEFDPDPRVEGTDDAGGWGNVMRDGERPTRFARVIRESADVYAARVERFLANGPDAVFRGR